MQVTDGEPIASTIRVEIGGAEVPRSFWASVRPKQGTPIHITRMPAGGGNGSKWIRTILMIVVMIVAWYAAPALAGAFGVTTASGIAAAMGAIYMVGALRVPALVPEIK
ncbi:hypothetical protein [Lysobacter sp. HA35]